MIHDGDVAHQFNPRGIHGYEHHALLQTSVSFGVGFSHHDQNPTVRMGCVGNKPLAAVNNIVVSVPNNFCPDLGGIGRRNVRLSHREG